MSIIIARHVREKIPHADVPTPHATLLSRKSSNITLDQLAAVVRNAPESTNELLSVSPDRVIVLGQQATTASLAFAFDSPCFNEEAEYYRSHIKFDAGLLPHITIATGIPYEAIERRRELAERAMSKLPKLSLLPVRMRIRAPLPDKSYDETALIR